MYFCQLGGQARQIGFEWTRLFLAFLSVRSVIHADIDMKVISQLSGCFILTGMKKPGCKIDHIAGLMAAKAIVVMIIHLHRRILVRVERAAGHTAVTDLQAIAFCSLKRRYTLFNFFKKIHISPYVFSRW